MGPRSIRKDPHNRPNSPRPHPFHIQVQIDSLPGGTSSPYSSASPKPAWRPMCLGPWDFFFRITRSILLMKERKIQARRRLKWKKNTDSKRKEKSQTQKNYFAPLKKASISIPNLANLSASSSTSVKHEKWHIHILSFILFHNELSFQGKPQFEDNHPSDSTERITIYNETPNKGSH